MMHKICVVINGQAAVGKDTLCDGVADRLKRYGVVKYSSVEAVKEIARQCGWDGSKDSRSRKFLSDLKNLTTEYNNFSMTQCLREVEKFSKSTYLIMFVMMREPDEIARFVNYLSGFTLITPKTVLIRRPDVEKCWGNESDDSVFDYAYDYHFFNETGETETSIESFSSLIYSLICDEEPKLC